MKPLPPTEKLPYYDQNLDFRSLFEQVRHIILIIHARTGKIIYANQSALDFYGYSEDDFNHLLIQDINQLSAEEVQEEMRQAELETRNYFYFRHRLKDGSIRQVEVLSRPVELYDQPYLLSVISPVEQQGRIRMLISDAFERSEEAIALLDPDYHVVAINQQFTKLFEYTVEEAKGKPIEDLVIPDHLGIQMEDHHSKALAGLMDNIETVRHTKSGKFIPVSILFLPFYSGNELLGSQVVYRDIREKLAQEEELKLFREIAHANTDGILITDANHLITWVNTSFEKLSGYSMQELIGHTPKKLSSGLHGPGWYELMWEKVATHGEWQGQIWDRTKDGEVRAQWLQIFPIKNKDHIIKNYVGVYKDLNEMDSVNKKMLLLVEQDPLTSVHNRIYFVEKLEETIRSTKRSIPVLFLDINGFKSINDTYGHDVGDHILIEFAMRLKRGFRDGVVARYGGDEFIISFTHGVTKPHLSRMLEEFKELLSMPFIIRERSFSLTCSIGVVWYPNDADTIDTLLRRADLTMYQAKRSRQFVAYFQELRTKEES